MQTVIVGVDTHKYQHVAVAIDRRGIRLGDHSFAADSAGYRALRAWAEAQGEIEAFGIEGPAATASACPVRSCVERGEWRCGDAPTATGVT